MGKRKKKYWSSLGEIHFLVVWEIHLDQRSNQLLFRCRTGWSNARRWLKWKGCGGVLRDHGDGGGQLGAGGLQPGGGLGQLGGGILLQRTMTLYFRYITCLNPKPIKTHLLTKDSPAGYPHHHHPRYQHHPNIWYCVQGHRRRHHPPHHPALLATRSTTALQRTPINEMLSFFFSRFCLSQGLRWEFCSQNFRVRDANELYFYYIPHVGFFM